MYAYFLYEDNATAIRYKIVLMFPHLKGGKNLDCHHGLTKRSKVMSTLAATPGISAEVFELIISQNVGTSHPRQ
jgi:hypothetical protein